MECGALRGADSGQLAKLNPRRGAIVTVNKGSLRTALSCLSATHHPLHKMVPDALTLGGHSSKAGGHQGGRVYGCCHSAMASLNSCSDEVCTCKEAACGGGGMLMPAAFDIVAEDEAALALSLVPAYTGDSAFDAEISNDGLDFLQDLQPEEVDRAESFSTWLPSLLEPRSAARSSTVEEAKEELRPDVGGRQGAALTVLPPPKLPRHSHLLTGALPSLSLLPRTLAAAAAAAAASPFSRAEDRLKRWRCVQCCAVCWESCHPSVVL